MAEEICIFTKDALIIKPPKKPPASLRMLVLVFAMACGLYICSICLKQTNVHTSTKFINIEVNQRHCNDDNIDRSQIPYLHYPRPNSFNRAECASNPVRLFTILSMQRSGSGWFETLLNSHTNMSSNGEIFSAKERRSNVSSILSTLDSIYNLDWFTSASKNQCSAAVGFKWMLNQVLAILISAISTRNNPSPDFTWHSILGPHYVEAKEMACFMLVEDIYHFVTLLSIINSQCSVKSVRNLETRVHRGLMDHHKEIVEYFNDKGVSVIFLFRRNLLRRMVSVLANSYDRYAKLLNGTHKSHVHSHEEAETLSKYKPVINSTSLVMDLKLMEKMVLDALEYFSSTRHIILYYEDLIKNRTKLNDVQEFLGLPKMELTSRQVKIHNGSLSEHIKNWDDIEKTLRGTTYESFLNTDYTT